MRYVAALAILIVTSACSARMGDQTKELVLEQQENSKYKLTAIFYGEGSSAKDAVIKHISIRNDASGGELVYKPLEAFDRNNTWKVWSPDSEFLLLMRGDFQGLCLIKASEAEQEIKSGSCSDFIRVYEKNTGTALVHTSGIWTSNDEFRFGAGLSGDMWNFSYNIKTLELKVEGSNKNFEGQNRYGKVDLK